MSYYLVWIKGRKAKCDVQLLPHKPVKSAQSIQPEVVRYMVISDEDAQLTLKELEEKYGSVYQSDTLEPGRRPVG